MLLQKVLFFGVSALLSTSVYAMTLNEALVLSLENNPAAIERIKHFNGVREAVKVAQAGYYPQLDVRVGMGYQDISNADTGFTKSSETVYESTIEMQQNLFNGFKTMHGVAKEEARLRAAAYSYVHTVNGAAYDLVKNYIDVIKYRELLHLCLQHIEGQLAIVKQVAVLYQDHMTTYASVQKSEASLALARSHYYATRHRYKEAQHRLKQSMGWDVNPQTLEVPNQVLQLPKTRADAVQFAIQNNPLVRMVDAESQAIQEAYEQMGGALLPTIDAKIHQVFNSNRNGIVGDEDDFKAMLTVSYNLYRGGADRAKRQQYISKMSQERAYQNNLKRQIMEHFDVAWSARKELSQQLQHLEKFEDYAKKSYRLYMQEYQQREGSLLDLMTAYSDLFQAQQERTALTYDLLQTRYRILDVMGTMVETIFGDTEALYSKVGISQDGTTIDTLPLNLDSDGDGYNDSEDLCQNSVSFQSVNRYGCSEVMQQGVDTLHGKENLLIAKLMQYEKVPEQSLIETEQPTVTATMLPPIVREKALHKEPAVSQPVAIPYVQKERQSPLEGHVIILGSFQAKASAEAAAMQFYDMEHALLVVEATKYRYNLKLVLQSRHKALELLKSVRVMVPDAWYAGKQRIVSYSVLSR